MDRKRLDLAYRLFGAGLVISQLVPFVPRRPEVLLIAGGLLGLRKIQDAQDTVNEIVKKYRE